MTNRSIFVSAAGLAVGLTAGALAQTARVALCETSAESALQAARAAAADQAAGRAGDQLGHHVAVAAFALAGSAAAVTQSVDKEDAQTFRRLTAEAQARGPEPVFTQITTHSGTDPESDDEDYGDDDYEDDDYEDDDYEDDDYEDDDFEDQKLELLDQMANSASEARIAAEAARSKLSRRAPDQFPQRSPQLSAHRARRMVARLHPSLRRLPQDTRRAARPTCGIPGASF